MFRAELLKLKPYPHGPLTVRSRLARRSGVLIRTYTHTQAVIYIEITTIHRCRQRQVGLGYIGACCSDGERSRYAVSSRVGTVSIISSQRAAYIFDGRSAAIHRAFRVTSVMRSNCKKLAPMARAMLIRHVSFFHRTRCNLGTFDTVKHHNVTGLLTTPSPPSVCDIAERSSFVFYSDQYFIAFNQIVLISLNNILVAFFYVCYTI